MTIEALTRDRWYDGNLWLTQPATGFRATSDAVMLAASVPDAADILELGVGGRGSIDDLSAATDVGTLDGGGSRSGDA